MPIWSKLITAWADYIGGGAKSPLWRGIFADIMEKPIVKLNFIEEATAVGAAIAGGVGVGIFSSLLDADKLVKAVQRTPVDRENSSVYRKHYDIFKRSYQQLVDIFSSLSES
jgi:xylulokinase